MDFYRFKAKAGELLVAETVPGALLDTVIGLFGPDGTLLAQNDDVASVFSRLIFPIPLDAEYTLAVTTFGDDNFTGQGRSIGRYILTLDTYSERFFRWVTTSLYKLLCRSSSLTREWTGRACG